uniref:FGFR1 oncogene partner (FOP) N-terminal dimerisation domain-containing protein n=1 Tax=Photinus pyralis TaxID=7054 RepID=A0A1Y1K7J3_PHOPY
MSVEEDVELRDLVAQTLELNGCLPKIRAQLRASIFLALDENEEVQNKEPLQNTKIKAQLESKTGRAMFCIVREFLEYFDLNFTISVFEPETYSGNGYQYEGRSQIIEDLGISQLNKDSNLPLLQQLIEIAQLKKNVIDINLNNIQSVTVSPDSVVSDPHPHLNETFDLSESNCVNNAMKDSNTDSQEDFSPPILKDTKRDSDKKLSQKADKLKNKSLTSLADLPPLQLGKTRNDTVLLPSLYSKEFKTNPSMKEIEQTFDVDLDGYEEDFMSDSEANLNKTYVEERAADTSSSQRSGGEDNMTENSNSLN